MSTKPIAFHLITLGVLAGLVLTLVSWLKLCSGMCNDAHNYRFLGMPFEVSGAIFFVLLGLLHLLDYRKLANMMIAGGLGAEAYFIFLQKYDIGAWCPVCLSIAGVIAFIGICSAYLTYEKGEGTMRKVVQVGLLACIFSMGFATSFLGVFKIDQLQASEDAIKQKIKFGNPASPVEVYVFTDWACPACRIVEPRIEEMGPRITKEAGLTFVDTVVHPETLSYAPFNIAFMANSKSDYYKVRQALGKLSITNKKPTEEDVIRVVTPLGVQYHELPYEDVAAAMRFFEELVDKFKVTGTPTVAIVNRQSKKGKKLSGSEEITEANVLKAIKALR